MRDPRARRPEPRPHWSEVKRLLSWSPILERRFVVVVSAAVVVIVIGCVDYDNDHDNDNEADTGVPSAQVIELWETAPGGQGVHREVESEGHEEKHRAVVDGSDPDDEPVGQRRGKVEPAL